MVVLFSSDALPFYYHRKNIFVAFGSCLGDNRIRLPDNTQFIIVNRYIAHAYEIVLESSVRLFKAKLLFQFKSHAYKREYK